MYATIHIHIHKNANHLVAPESKTCLNKLFIKPLSRVSTGPSCDLCFENYIELKYLQINALCIFKCLLSFFSIQLFFEEFMETVAG